MSSHRILRALLVSTVLGAGKRLYPDGVAGERILQETRHFDKASGRTAAGRSKEEATDYRYFPEPDLTPLALSREYIEAIGASLPELPSQRRAELPARA